MTGNGTVLWLRSSGTSIGELSHEIRASREGPPTATKCRLGEGPIPSSLREYTIM
jgi:hypothetical protein